MTPVRGKTTARVRSRRAVARRRRHRRGRARRGCADPRHGRLRVRCRGGRLTEAFDSVGGGSAVTADNCPTKQPDPLPAGETRTVSLNTEKGTIVIKVAGRSLADRRRKLRGLGGVRVLRRDAVPPDREAAGRHPVRDPGRRPDGNRNRRSRLTIKDEPVTTPYKRGTVAMARTSQPDSAGSQYFIVLDDKDADVLASPTPIRSSAT